MTKKQLVVLLGVYLAGMLAMIVCACGQVRAEPAPPHPDGFVDLGVMPSGVRCVEHWKDGHSLLVYSKEKSQRVPTDNGCSDAVSVTVVHNPGCSGCRREK